MKLSTKGRYGLRALIDLASCEDECEVVSIQSIAERQKISESYLEQLVRLLKKAGLVTSQRGACGGYRLAKPAEQISVGDILRALEGNLDAVTCPANQDDSGAGCQDADFCVTRYVWKQINDSITLTVNSIMLDQLVQENRKLRSQGKSTGNCVN
ncbi:MAG: Rrf2 family transcriptional regulator [Lachnospiraceae bacterium]|nr:Rrf2 family transcriptional regulator [Lachnospiraceae bacterium]